MRRLFLPCLLVALAQPGLAPAQDLVREVSAVRVRDEATGKDLSGGLTVLVYLEKNLQPDGDWGQPLAFKLADVTVRISGAEYDPAGAVMEPAHEIMTWFAVNCPVSIQVSGNGKTIDLAPIKGAARDKYFADWKSKPGYARPVALDFNQPTMAECRKMWAPFLRNGRPASDPRDVPLITPDWTPTPPTPPVRRRPVLPPIQIRPSSPRQID